MNQSRDQSGNALVWILLLVVIAAGAGYYFYFMDRGNGGTEPLPPSPPAATEPEPKSEPDVRTEPQRDPGTIRSDEPAEPEVDVQEAESLPPLEESDEEVMKVAQGLVGETAARENIVSEAIVSRLVATVDALTLEELPKNIVPVQGPGGAFQATSDGVSQEVNPETGLPEPRYVLDPVNFQRYTSQVEIFEALETIALVEEYRAYYPLLQQSYRELGYPEGEFEDRLAEVIDHLLATPEPARPVRLVKPEAFYEFEDPELESLSAGQKLLIRVGPSNAARIKAKLSEIRDALQTQRE